MKTKMLRRIISVICAVGISASCATGFVNAAEIKKNDSKAIFLKKEEMKKIREREKKAKQIITENIKKDKQEKIDIKKKIEKQEKEAEKRKKDFDDLRRKRRENLEILEKERIEKIQERIINEFR